MTKTNQDIIEAAEGDFMGFLEEKDWDSANLVIDNLADMKEYPKALELCMKRCAAIMKDRMTLPADYGEEKPKTVFDHIMSVNDDLFNAARNPLNNVKVEGVEEEVKEENRCCIACYDVTAAPNKEHSAHSPYWKSCCTNRNCKCHEEEVVY